jgi:hypothetical protein
VISRWFNPTGFFWVFCHLILLPVGIIFMIWPLDAYTEATKVAFQGIGTSLIATAISGELLFLYVRASDNIRSKIDILTNAGLTSVFSTRSVQIKPEYDKRLSTAREIDIIGFGMASLREDFGPEFPAWSHKAKVRILLLDPDFPTKKDSLADQRDKEENHAPGKIREDVAQFLKYLREKDGIQEDRFEVRLMRCLPSINMFRVDNELFWGPYLLSHPSRNTPTLLVGPGFLYHRLRAHFDSLWESDEFSSQAFPP